MEVRWLYSALMELAFIALKKKGVTNQQQNFRAKSSSLVTPTSQSPKSKWLKEVKQWRYRMYKLWKTYEDLKHFLLDCPLYEEDRQELFRIFQNKNNIDLKEVTPEESFYLLLNVNNISKQLAQMIQNSLQKRQQLQN